MTTLKSRRSIGIITIATGEYYAQFIPKLRDSIARYWNFDAAEIQFYCFTDTLVKRPDIISLPILHLGWPFATLLRFHWIKEQLAQLLHHDFLLYMDADMEVVKPMPFSVFSDSLIAVRHPGFVDTPGAFEIDRQEKTYVPPPLRKTYYQGCFWGGSSSEFAKLINTLTKCVEEDLALARIPIWHDESYLNWYFSRHSCVPLSPLYAWPQSETLVGEKPFILHLEKRHNRIRQIEAQELTLPSILRGLSIQEQADFYKNLYLQAHEKCQRLEQKMSARFSCLARFREWLAYFKNR